MVRTEVAVPLPGVSEDGEKLAVAPCGSPDALSLITLLYGPPEVPTVIVKWAAPPRATVAEDDVVDTVKSPCAGAVPVPESATVCSDPAALSAIERVAAKLAAEAGVKVTEIEQLAPAASDVPQVLVCAKSDGLAPASVIPEIVSAALPVFLSVAVCAAEVVPVVAVKLSDDGVSDAIGAGGTVPVPLSWTVCGEPVALSTIESVAAKLAAEAGVKVTEIEQLAPAASELPQVLVWAKSDGLVPASVMPEIVSAALPVFLSAAVCAADVVPVLVVNIRLVGVRETAGTGLAVPVPLREMTLGEPDALLVTVTEAE